MIKYLLGVASGVIITINWIPIAAALSAGMLKTAEVIKQLSQMM